MLLNDVYVMCHLSKMYYPDRCYNLRFQTNYDTRVVRVRAKVWSDEAQRRGFPHEFVQIEKAGGRNEDQRGRGDGARAQSGDSWWDIVQLSLLSC